MKIKSFYKKILSALFFIGVFFSCREQVNSGLPAYTGNQGEIVVVINKPVWESTVGTSLKNSLQEDQEGLPQPEAPFKIVQIPHRSFSRIFQIHRNLLIFKLTDSPKKDFEVQRSVWAKNQLVITIAAKTKEELNAIYNKNKTTILTYFTDIAQDRIVKRNKKFGSKGLRNKLKEKHNYAIYPQKDLYLATDSAHFVWLRLERERPLGGFQHQISQGIVIYDYPYTDTSIFNTNYLIHIRDSVLKIHLPGPSEGSYMITSHKLNEPIGKAVNFRNNFGYEIRGLWRMEGDFMGGPFYSLTTIDTKNNRVVTIEGYVFSPQFPKKEYLREVEGMAKSLQFFVKPK